MAQAGHWLMKMDCRVKPGNDNFGSTTLRMI